MPKHDVIEASIWRGGNVPEKIILPQESQVGLYYTITVLLIDSCTIYRRYFICTGCLASNSWDMDMNIVEYMLCKEVVAVYLKLLFQNFPGGNEGK